MCSPWVGVNKQVCVYVCVRLNVPVWRSPLAVLVELQEDLRGVERRVGIGVQQQLLVLCQVLSGGLFGQTGTVQQLPLQEGQIGLTRTHTQI